MNICKKSVNQEYMKAVKYYARKSIDGSILSKDINKADQLLSKYLKKEDAGIIFLYGYLLAKKNKTDQSKQYLLEASNKGYSEAFYELGMICYKKENYKEAKNYFEKAKKKGFLKKPPNIGKELHQKAMTLFYGIGCKVDIKSGFEFFILASQENFVPSIKEVAKIYYNGHPPKIKMDRSKAFDYYKKAADKGDVLSMKKCGYMLINGIGINKNRIISLQYYKKAADAGDMKAIINYARILKNETIKYLNKGVLKGDKGCIDEMQASLKRKIRSFQLMTMMMV